MQLDGVILLATSPIGIAWFNIDTVKPGFHPNAIACVAFLAVFIYATNAMQAIAFGWKPGFTVLML